MSYSLSSRVGWIAIGFGTRMVDSAMVVMWANADDSVTLLHRAATGDVYPKPTTTTVVPGSTSTTTAPKAFAFTVLTDGTAIQPLIWAYSTIRPNSSSLNSTFAIHDDAGTFILDLTKPLPIASVSGSASDSAPPATASVRQIHRTKGGGGATLPREAATRVLTAHAALCGGGFLVLLPLGALLARYMRTFSTRWYTVHWVLQFGITLPVLVAGSAFGYYAAWTHVDDTHKILGTALLVAYALQCVLGAVIHYLKPRSWSASGAGPRQRPPQNHAPAVLGLGLVGTAFYQVRNGYADEWPTTGRETPPGVKIAWLAWVCMFPALYAAGLSLLRRQLIKEVYTTQTCGSASSTDQVTTGRPEGGSRSGSDDPLSPTIHEA